MDFALICHPRARLYRIDKAEVRGLGSAGLTPAAFSSARVMPASFGSAWLTPAAFQMSRAAARTVHLPVALQPARLLSAAFGSVALTSASLGSVRRVPRLICWATVRIYQISVTCVRVLGSEWLKPTAFMLQG